MRARALMLALALLAPRGAGAQEAEPRRWAAALTWTGDRFEDATPRWEGWSALEGRLERRFERGSVALEGGSFRRFGHTDPAGGVDLYLELWPASYGNLHVRIAQDADVLARSDVALELFQGFAGGWEPSAGFREMRFADGTVRMGSVAVARSIGPWYARARLTHGWRSGAGGTSVGALLRRTLRADDEQLEAFIATGTEVVSLPGAAGAVVTELRSTTTAGLGARVRLTGPLGLALSLGYTTFEPAPARVTGGAGVIVRW
jgi:YaiO family outer membrane protein